jgi:hypothetical protein
MEGLGKRAHHEDSYEDGSQSEDNAENYDTKR